MLFANVVRRSAWAGVAAIALMGAGCAAQQAGTPQTAASVSSAQVLRAGTVLNVGQGTYVMPALPPSASETSYALTGKETPHQWQQPQGQWIGGTNGTAFIPPAP
jgi:hypothetical protein